MTRSRCRHSIPANENRVRGRRMRHAVGVPILRPWLWWRRSSSRYATIPAWWTLDFNNAGNTSTLWPMSAWLFAISLLPLTLFAPPSILPSSATTSAITDISKSHLSHLECSIVPRKAYLLSLPRLSSVSVNSEALEAFSSSSFSLPLPFSGSVTGN